MVVAHKIIDTSSLEMLAIGLDQVLQGLNQTPWLGCFLFAITVTDCHAKNLIKFLKVLRKYTATQSVLISVMVLKSIQMYELKLKSPLESTADLGLFTNVKKKKKNLPCVLGTN